MEVIHLVPKEQISEHTVEEIVVLVPHVMDETTETAKIIPQKSARLLGCIRGCPWRRSTGRVQCEPGEVPTMIASEPVGPAPADGNGDACTSGGTSKFGSTTSRSGYMAAYARVEVNRPAREEAGHNPTA